MHKLKYFNNYISQYICVEIEIKENLEIENIFIFHNEFKIYNYGQISLALNSKIEKITVLAF